MQIFKSKLAKTETATVQMNADEITKLKAAVGAQVGATSIVLINGVSMHQLPNRWFTVVADDAPISKVERIEAALKLIESAVNGDVVAKATDNGNDTPDDVPPTVSASSASAAAGAGASAKPSQLLMKMFSRLSF